MLRYHRNIWNNRLNFPPSPSLTPLPPVRSGYEKKDAVISRKYKWLEDLNQRDPDLEGIEISESSLEELKKKRESLVRTVRCATWLLV